MGGWPRSRRGWLGVQVCTRGARCWGGPAGHTSGLDVPTPLHEGPARPGLFPTAPCREAGPLGVWLWSCLWPPSPEAGAVLGGQGSGQAPRGLRCLGGASPSPPRLPRQFGSEGRGFLQASSNPRLPALSWSTGCVLGGGGSRSPCRLARGLSADSGYS